MIIENDKYDEIRKLFNENNDNFITKESNEYGINNKEMLKAIYIENKVAKGYIIVSFDRNFCELEEYPNKIAYIWEILTDKKYSGKGIATQLLKYVVEKYNDYTFYSCIEEENIGSIKVHQKLGFKEIYKFEGKYFEGKISKEIMFELRR